MSTQILAMLDDEKIADEATKEISALDYDDVTWQFINSDPGDTRIVPGTPAHGGTGIGRPMGFVHESDAPTGFALSDLDISDDEKTFYAKGLERNAIVILIEAPEDAVAAVEAILDKHDAGRYVEA